LRRCGNPEPTSTHGKKPDEAKALELKGWPYRAISKAGISASLVTCDSVGAETLRRSLVDWLTDMSLISAGPGMSEADGYIGYMEPYATSHQRSTRTTRSRRTCATFARALGKAVKRIAPENTRSRARDWPIRIRSDFVVPAKAGTITTGECFAMIGPQPCNNNSGGYGSPLSRDDSWRVTPPRSAAFAARVMPV